MKLVPLGEVATLGSGGTPKRSIPEYFGNDFPWVSIADLNDGYVHSTREGLTIHGLNNSSAKLIPAGSLLIAMYGSIGKLGITTTEMCTSQAIAFALPNPDLVDTRYLYNFFLSRRKQLQNLGRGGTQQNISQGDLRKLGIPLPPLDEQRRIAAILDKADVIRQKRRRVIEHSDTLTKSIFQAMFGDPINNTFNWPKARLESVAEIKTGNSPARSHPEFFGKGFEWIKSDCLGSVIATPAHERLSELGREKARIAPAGSVLVTCIAGSPNSIGKCSLVDRDVAFNQQINAIITSQNLDSKFLLWQLKNSPQLVRSKSSGGMKGLVSKSAFSTIEILLPPPEAQQRFAGLAQIVGDSTVKMEQRSIREDALFASLQSRAFGGEL